MNTKRLWVKSARVVVGGPAQSVGGFGTVNAHHVIVDTDYVLKNKDKPGVVLVDVRAASDYKKGLIPGAVVLGRRLGRWPSRTWMRASCR